MNTTTTVVTRRNLVHSACDNTGDNYKFNTVLLELHTPKAQVLVSNKILIIFKIVTERIKLSVRSVVAAVAA